MEPPQNHRSKSLGPRREGILLKFSVDNIRTLARFSVQLPIIQMKHILISSIVGAIGLVAAYGAEINQPAPDFTAKNAKGESVSLADFKGKVVVLEWVRFDCPFVKKHYSSGNMPTLQANYTGKDVVWLSVNSSAPGKPGHHEPAALAALAAKEGNKASHVLIDADGKVGKAYDAKVTPHLFIINKDGKLAYNGAIDSKDSTKPEDVATADKLFANALDAVLAGKVVSNAKNKPYGCGVKY